MTRLINLTLTALFFTMFFSQMTFAAQPYQTIINDPSYYAVPQVIGDGVNMPTCGATSWYMVWRYHVLRNGVNPGQSDPKCYYSYCPGLCPAYLADDIHYPEQLDSETDTYMYISKNQYDCALWGPMLSRMKYAADKLKYMNGTKVFNHIGYYTTRTRDTSTKIAQFDLLVSGYLNNNTPVVVHLERDGSVGHYITLVGYDGSYVYFINPDVANHENNGICLASGGDDCLLQKISYSAFINNDWYHRDNNSDAYWDATWLGFRP